MYQPRGQGGLTLDDAEGNRKVISCRMVQGLLPYQERAAYFDSVRTVTSPTLFHSIQTAHGNSILNAFNSLLDNQRDNVDDGVTLTLDHLFFDRVNTMENPHPEQLILALPQPIHEDLLGIVKDLPLVLLQQPGGNNGVDEGVTLVDELRLQIKDLEECLVEWEEYSKELKSKNDELTLENQRLRETL